MSLIKINGKDIKIVSLFKINTGSVPHIAHLVISDGLVYVWRGNVLMAYDLRLRS
jgi:uncharacterized protein with ACT and thioredoxin-like domain